MTDSNLPSAHEKQEVNVAESNAPSTQEKQNVDNGNNTKPVLNNEQVKRVDNDTPSGPEKEKVEGDNAKLPVNKEESNMVDDDLASALEKQKLIGTATSDMEYRVQLFNRLSDTCFHKCADKRYKEPELSIGESACIDRCVSKYDQVNNRIGQILASGKHRR